MMACTTTPSTQTSTLTSTGAVKTFDFLGLPPELQIAVLSNMHDIELLKCFLTNKVVIDRLHHYFKIITFPAESPSLYLGDLDRRIERLQLERAEWLNKTEDVVHGSVFLVEVSSYKTEPYRSVRRLLRGSQFVLVAYLAEREGDLTVPLDNRHPELDGIFSDFNADTCWCGLLLANNQKPMVTNSFIDSDGHLNFTSRKGNTLSAKVRLAILSHLDVWAFEPTSLSQPDPDLSDSIIVGAVHSVCIQGLSGSTLSSVVNGLRQLWKAALDIQLKSDFPSHAFPYQARQKTLVPVKLCGIQFPASLQILNVLRCSSFCDITFSVSKRSLSASNPPRTVVICLDPSQPHVPPKICGVRAENVKVFELWCPTLCPVLSDLHFPDIERLTIGALSLLRMTAGISEGEASFELTSSFIFNIAPIIKRITSLLLGKNYSCLLSKPLFDYLPNMKHLSMAIDRTDSRGASPTVMMPNLKVLAWYEYSKANSSGHTSLISVPPSHIQCPHLREATAEIEGQIFSMATLLSRFPEVKRLKISPCDFAHQLNDRYYYEDVAADHVGPITINNSLEELYVSIGHTRALLKNVVFGALTHLELVLNPYELPCGEFNADMPVLKTLILARALLSPNFRHRYPPTIPKLTIRGFPSLEKFSLRHGFATVVLDGSPGLRIVEVVDKDQAVEHLISTAPLPDLLRLCYVSRGKLERHNFSVGPLVNVCITDESWEYEV